jgi:Lrp/AsnC family leucine-responsive transcriptional regulator
MMFTENSVLLMNIRQERYVTRVDNKDVALLEILQTNARVRLEDLGRSVELAASSVHERLRRLDRDFVIRRWTIDLDPSAFGLDTLALVGVRATRPCSDIVSLLEPLTEIEECHSVAGSLSLILKVRVRSPGDLLAFVEGLRRIPGVEGSETTVILKSHFERGLRPSVLA